MNTRNILGRIAIVFVVAAIGMWFAYHSYAAETPNITLSVANVGPRQVEEPTQNAIVRDYGRAWAAMARAMEENNPSALGEIWVGNAKEKLLASIDAQKNAGMTSRIVDRGHKLQAVFYSAEGSALQLRDTATVETQVLDGNNVVATDTATVNYIVLMTPAADGWQVRILQAVPGV